jgi:methanogenic corrinoid protein MtbC1
MGRRRLSVSPLVEALLSSRSAVATGLAGEALTECGSRVSLVSDYLQPALYAISELWYQGAIRAAEERNASEIMGRIVEQLRPTPATDQIEAGSRLVLAALEGEQHLLGMRILGLVLQDEGWEVEVLPQGRFAELVKHVDNTRPHVVGISCGYLPEPQRLASTVSALHASRCRVMVGGPAINRVPGLWSRLGADAVGVDARVAAVVARQQLARWKRRASLEERFRQRSAPRRRGGPLTLRQAAS